MYKLLSTLLVILLIFFSNNVCSMINQKGQQEVERARRGELSAELQVLFRECNAGEDKGEQSSPAGAAIEIQEVAYFSEKIQDLQRKKKVDLSPDVEQDDDIAFDEKIEAYIRNLSEDSEEDEGDLEEPNCNSKDSEEEGEIASRKKLNRSSQERISSFQELLAKHKQQLEERRRELKKIFKKKLFEEKKTALSHLRILGVELRESEVKKLTRPPKGRFYHGDIVAYKVGENKYVYAQVKRIWRAEIGLEYGIVVSVVGEHKKVVHVEGKNLFEISK